MAKQKNNIIMRSTRGMVGGQIVFKRRAGKGYVSAAPEVNENRKPTEKQLAVQEKFKTSTAYAQLAIKDAGLKKAYKAAALRGQTAYNVAFQDASYAPKVIALFTDGYTGVIGNTLVVRATDNFKVAIVKVSIRNANGELIEEGPAELSTGDLWIYTVTQSNFNINGTKIKATAFDMPENEGSLEVTL